MADFASNYIQSIPDNQTERKSRNSASEFERGRRILSQIQATLGGKTTTQSAAQRSIRKKPVGDSTLTNVDEMIAKLKLADEDVEITAKDIRPYLMKYGRTFTVEDFERIADSFCYSALTFMNIHFIVELCVILIKYKDFQFEMSMKLDEHISNFIIKSDPKLDAIPALMANLLTAKWPRPYNKAIFDSNNILVTIISSIMGWIMVIKDHFLKNQDEFDENANAVENFDMVIKCGKALCELCNTGQRGLWMNFPNLLDDVFETVQGLLISELPISKSMRKSFLQLYVSILKWTTANTRTMISVSTQTLTKPF